MICLTGPARAACGPISKNATSLTLSRIPFTADLKRTGDSRFLCQYFAPKIISSCRPVPVTLE
ncbi:hypothetical protein I7I50_00978 [Histoplasma capsulatum G186AR]|uniref:Uncharacterized protein n=1 Tax=Ajellomyces capsulatus TaxID=5037 RepID=A0A8H7YKB8_AJECA|nr:hypothetical protein I7I52_08244 [Histoplasma capsulatum]QSS72971.1 hypothetical protein I7I50_00978 [Histoplasma capsulatum G186AR]